MPNDFDSKYLGKNRDGRFFTRVKSRFQQLAANNLGVVYEGQVATRALVRNEQIDLYDKYYDCDQYEHLEPWDQACCADDYVAIRKRKPRINYAFAKMLSSRIASKLVGHTNYPSLTVSDDPDTTEFIKVLQAASRLQPRMMEPMKRLVVAGSVFVRFQIIGPVIKVEWYNSKYCYPKFDESGDLQEIEIRYVFEDENDLDSKGCPKKKWFQMQLGKMSDVLFDNPPYQPAVKPNFTVASQVDHELGFVQGEWFRTTEEKFSSDGYSMIADIMDFIDEINYNLSQSSQAISYNQDPQLVINSMDEEEMGELIKSATKAWNLGRDGKAQFLESDLGGVKTAGEYRDKIRLGIQDIARVVLLDPEKMVTHAQSGKAMEVLHGPFVELLNELRPMVEHGLIALVTKMALTILILESRGIDTPVTIPAGYAPKSLDITADWPAIFPMTTSDMKELVAVVTAATGGNVLSREWGTRFLAKIKEFGVENPEEEIAKIAAQPVLNPFGGF